MTKKLTPDELRDELLGHIAWIAKYWSKLPDIDPVTGHKLTALDRCNGVAHSILTALDGCSAQMPCCFDLTSSVHPDDEDQSYNGITISDMLHEHFGRFQIWGGK